MDALRHRCYTVRLWVKVDAAGMLGAHLMSSSGNAQLDAKITGVVTHLPPPTARPPPDMPWPVGLEIVSQAPDCHEGR